MKYIKYIIILIALIPTYGYAAPNKTYLTNSVFVATTTAGCLEFSALGEIFSKGVNCGSGGGGSAGGTWSTTTSTVSGQLINYANNATDIVTVGSTATTTAPFYLNPNTGSAVFGSTLPEPMSNLALEENYQLSLVKPVSILASTTGIGFGISGSGRNNIGGVMLYARTGSSSKGEFRWYTKGVQTSGVSPTFGMVLTDTQRLGIGTSTPYAMLSVAGDVVAANYTATTTATSTFAGGIQTNLLNVTSATASSTFANGINLTGGCFAIGGTCVTGGGGGSSANPTITTTLPFTNCEAQTDSYDFAPGGAYIQPIYGATFTNGTSSAIACDLTIPDNVSATPNGVIMPYLTATTTGNSVFEVNATTTSIGQNWIPTSYTNLLASTSAASRIAVTGGANYPLTSTTTISTNTLNIVAGSILKVRFVNYHADANDTVENDLFMPKAVYKFDIKVN